MADKKQLGAWDSERVVVEQTPLNGRGNDADASAPVRFSRAVVQLVARREHSADAEYDRPAAFVLLPREGFEQLPEAAVRQPLLHTGHHTLTGHVHFVNVVLSGHSLVYAGDAGALFQTLIASGVAALPTLVYSPKKGESTLTWYPNGIAKEELLDVWSMADEQPNADEIAEVVGRAHSGELITPDQTPKDFQVWENAQNGMAHRAAEARVQRTIRLALLGAFRRCSVRAEQPDKDGRTDLEIVEHRKTTYEVVNHAVLELKVLREKGSTGNEYSDKDIDQHMRDGLEQAYSYGDGRHFRERMLCCFDMRAVNSGAEAVLAPLRDDAKTLGVDLRHWFLYRSSEHWRQCKVAHALKA